MELTWTRVASEDSAIPALEVRLAPGQSYAGLVREVAELVTRDDPGTWRPWEFLMVSEEDNARNRALGFWRRYGVSLGAGLDGAEATRAVDGRLLKAAARRLDTADELVRVLTDRERLRFRRGTLLPTTETVGPILDAALRMPTSDGYAFVANLAVAATGEGCNVMVQDETERHEPSLLICGGIENLEGIEALLAHSD